MATPLHPQVHASNARTPGLQLLAAKRPARPHAWHEYGLPMAAEVVKAKRRGLLGRMQKAKESSQHGSQVEAGSTEPSMESEGTDSWDGDDDGDVDSYAVGWSDDDNVALEVCLETLRVRGL